MLLLSELDTCLCTHLTELEVSLHLYADRMVIIMTLKWQ